MLNKEELERYARQIMLPEIGEAGQEALKKARILVAGAGGLGSISLMYLAAAGVGTLVVVDDDRVSLSNLNRQVIHSSKSLGKEKVRSAGERIHGLNPLVNVALVPERITAQNAPEMVCGVDVVVDATDNLMTRKALNRASVSHGVPFVFGGVSGFDGMMATFVPGRTSCLECLFPGEGAVSDPGGVGVIGPAPGVVASLQAMAVMMLILGRDHGSVGSLLRFRGKTMTMKTIRIPQDPECPVCGCGIADSENLP